VWVEEVLGDVVLLPLPLRQYVYFCTSKASKQRTCSLKQGGGSLLVGGGVQEADGEGGGSVGCGG
jgi:hypothetical protein